MKNIKSLNKKKARIYRAKRVNFVTPFVLQCYCPFSFPPYSQTKTDKKSNTKGDCLLFIKNFRKMFLSFLFSFPSQTKREKKNDT